MMAIVKGNFNVKRFFIEVLLKLFFLFLLTLFIVEIGWSQEVRKWTLLSVLVVVVLIAYPVKEELIKKTWILKLFCYLFLVVKLCFDKIFADNYFSLTDLDTLSILFLFMAIYYDALKIRKAKHL